MLKWLKIEHLSLTNVVNKTNIYLGSICYDYKILKINAWSLMSQYNG